MSNAHAQTRTPTKLVCRSSSSPTMRSSDPEPRYEYRQRKSSQRYITATYRNPTSTQPPQHIPLFVDGHCGDHGRHQQQQQQRGRHSSGVHVGNKSAGGVSHGSLITLMFEVRCVAQLSMVVPSRPACPSPRDSSDGVANLRRSDAVPADGMMVGIPDPGPSNTNRPGGRSTWAAFSAHTSESVFNKTQTAWNVLALIAEVVFERLTVIPCRGDRPGNSLVGRQ